MNNPPKNEMVTCPNCFGKGEVLEAETIGMSKVRISSTCKYCQGSGKIPNIRS
ncbi:zinc finger domain-containing protein [Nostoc sp.]|uniref:zinc finger domain-containing protein n=1 Tax=Nostoc sp. TaxID=1180 RepID=UPI003FA5CCF9